MKQSNEFNGRRNSDRSEELIELNMQLKAAFGQQKSKRDRGMHE